MIDVLKSLIRQFMPFAKEKMGFSRPPKLFLRQDKENAANPMGKTGFYDPENESITLYTTGRHPKDIMRSLAHELQHHTQKCNGEFENMENMGEEGYAQTNMHMRSMEIQAYQASIVFRDWEDSTKGTIYYEHLQKGDKSSMSSKNWKNRELNGLLMERFGFEFKPLVENLEEGFEKPKSATGSGPSKKGGKIDRTDVANKDSSKFGQGGSKKAAKPSASGTNAVSKAGKMDRSDVANKATGRWLKEAADKIKEMCPDMQHSHEEGDELDAEGELEGFASRAIAAIHEFAEAAGVDMSTTVMTGEEDIEQQEAELEERRGRGRMGPHIRGPQDPRLREMVAEIVKETLKGN